MQRDWDEEEEKDVAECEFSELKGKAFVTIMGCEVGSDRIIFIPEHGNTVYRLTYYADCCANCSVEEIHGDPQDLIGSKILHAELVTSRNDGNPKEEYEDSYTWSFYKLSTIKGSVTIRWYGSSNGYYSEEATFERVQTVIVVK